MAQIVFNHIGRKSPFFDGTSSFDYWKRKMKMYLGSINDGLGGRRPSSRRWRPHSGGDAGLALEAGGEGSSVRRYWCKS